jgi:hypothetical protein
MAAMRRHRPATGQVRRAAAAVGFVALLAVALLAGLPAATAPGVNRPPHPELGPDKDVRDSFAPCGGQQTAGCTRIDFNFNRSWDPDGDALDKPTSFVITYAMSPNVAAQCAFIAPQGGGVTFQPGEEPGQYFTYAPIIADPTITQCVNTLTVTVRDGNQNAAAPNYCCATDTVVVTVRNLSGPPRFPCQTETTCAATALLVNGLTNARVDLLLNRGTNIILEANGITDDRTTETVQVYLDQVNDREEVVHRLVVPMTKCRIQADCPSQVPTSDCCVSAPTQPETSQWRGVLPVDTRELIRGAYNVWARAWDRDGGNASFPMEVVRLEVDGPESSCPANVPDATPPTCILLNEPATLGRMEPGKGFGTTCFPQALPAPRDREAYAVGHGETVRPIIQVYYPSAEDTDPTTGEPYQLSDPNLFLWKATYQVCTEDETGRAIYGTETPFHAPYYIPIDALFKGAQVDQDINIKVYDRLGGTYSKAFHVVTDTLQPRFLIDAPQVNYQGIPFKVNVFVHDRLQSAVSLHVESLELGLDLDATGEPSTPPRTPLTLPYKDGLLGCDKEKTKCTVGELNVIQVPRLGDAIAFDMGGPHNGSAPCDYLFDSDLDGVPDSVFDAAEMTIAGRLLRVPRGAVSDYVLDVDRNGRAGSTEPRANGTVGAGIAQRDRCVHVLPEAVAQFLASDTTQVFSFGMTRRTLGTTSYRITIRDLAFNNFAAPTDTFLYPPGCVPDTRTEAQVAAGRPPPVGVCQEHESSLNGHFTTVRAKLDAKVTALTVAAKGLLPGDPVWVNATVRQAGLPDQKPEPSVYLVLQLDDQVRMRCMLAYLALEGANMTQAERDAAAAADCPTPSFRSTCPVPANSTVPVLEGRTKCYTLFPPPYGDLDKAALLLRPDLMLPWEVQPGDCAPPADLVHEFTVCVPRPDVRTPASARDRELRVPYVPGPHRVAAYVHVPDLVNDTEEHAALAAGGTPNNYAESGTFEVFLGRVVHGTLDASGHAKTGKEYHIRADCPPERNGVQPPCRPSPPVGNGTFGAVLLDADGKVAKEYTLTLAQEPEIRYEFTVDGETLFWAPARRQSVAPALCGIEDAQSKACQRPITLIEASKAKATTTKAAPAPLLALLVALAAAAVLLRRRQA